MKQAFQPVLHSSSLRRSTLGVRSSTFSTPHVPHSWDTRSVTPHPRKKPQNPPIRTDPSPNLTINPPPKHPFSSLNTALLHIHKTHVFNNLQIFIQHQFPIPHPQSPSPYFFSVSSIFLALPPLPLFPVPETYECEKEMCPAFSPPLPPSSTSLDTESLKPIPKNKKLTLS